MIIQSRACFHTIGRCRVWHCRVSDSVMVTFSFTPIHVCREAEVLVAQDTRVFLLASASVEIERLRLGKLGSKELRRNSRISNKILRLFRFAGPVNCPTARITLRAFCCWLYCCFCCFRCGLNNIINENNFLNEKSLFHNLPKIKLTSKGIASVCDTNMLRHTAAIIATRHNLIIPDIVPGKLIIWHKILHNN